MTLSAQIALQLGTLELRADLEVKPGELLALLGPCLLYTSPSPRD